MSFDNIKRDMASFEGRKNLSMDEMLSLYKSLEEDINAMSRCDMGDYVIASDEYENDTLMPNFIWLGNLFSSIYTKNKGGMDARTGKITRGLITKAVDFTEELKELEKEIEGFEKRKKEEKVKYLHLVDEQSRLSEELTEIKERNSGIEAQKLKLQREIESEETGSSLLKAELAMLKEEKEKSKTDLTLFSVDIEKLKKENEDFVKKFLEPKKAELEQEQEKLSKAKEECSYLEKKFDVTSKELKSVGENMQKIEGDISDCKNKIDALRSECDAGNMLLEQYKNDEVKLSADIDVKASEKAKLDEKIKELEERLSTVREEITKADLHTLPDLEKQIKDAEIRKAELNEEIAKLTCENEGYQKNIVEKEQGVKERKEEQDELQKKLRTLQIDNDGLIETIEELRSTLKDNDPEQLRNNLLETKASYEKKIEEAKELERALAEKQKEFEDKNSEVTQAQREMDEVTEKCEELTEKLRVLNDEDALYKLEVLKKRRVFLENVEENIESVSKKYAENGELTDTANLLKKVLSDSKKQMDTAQEQIKKIQIYYKENAL